MNMATADKKNLVTDFLYQSFNDLPLYDQRYIPRWKTNKRAYFRFKDSRVIHQTHIKDLSLSGVCLYASGDAQVGENVELKIYLTEEVGFIAEGTIIWALTSDHDHVCLGIIFKMLPQPVQDLMVQYAFDTADIKVDV